MATERAVGAAMRAASASASTRPARLCALRQGHRRVRYREYARVGEIWLPRKLTITAAPGFEPLSVIVLLQSWRDVRFDD